MAAKKLHFAVDLDSTLAFYEKFQGPEIIGEPIPAMVDRVKGWLAEGHKVSIFTARVSHPVDGEQCREAIEAWSEEHIGQRLEVTCIKDYKFDEFWDDRAVTVGYNTGEQLSPSRRSIVEAYNAS